MSNVGNKRKLSESDAFVASAKKYIASCGLRPIPDSVKISVQLLLLNFHAQNSLPVNCLPAEYESVFGKKFDLYGFPDVESMLRSPQMKGNVATFSNNKIPSVRGLPLPRSVYMRTDGNSWVINPYGSLQAQGAEELVKNVNCDSISNCQSQTILPIPNSNETPCSAEEDNKTNLTCKPVESGDPRLRPRNNIPYTVQPEDVPLINSHQASSTDVVPKTVDLAMPADKNMVNESQSEKQSPNPLETSNKSEYFRRSDVPETYTFQRIEGTESNEGGQTDPPICPNGKQLQSGIEQHRVNDLHPPPFSETTFNTQPAGFSQLSKLPDNPQLKSNNCAPQPVIRIPQQSNIPNTRHLSVSPQLKSYRNPDQPDDKEPQQSNKCTHVAPSGCISKQPGDSVQVQVPQQSQISPHPAINSLQNLRPLLNPQFIFQAKPTNLLNSSFDRNSEVQEKSGIFTSVVNSVRSQEHQVNNSEPVELNPIKPITKELNDQSHSSQECLAKVANEPSVTKPGKAIPQIIIGKINPPGGVRKFYKHNKPDTSFITTDNGNLVSLKLKDLLQGRSLVKKNSHGLYCSLEHPSELYIDLGVFNRFEDCMSRVKAVGLCYLENAQAILCRALKNRFPFDSCFVYYAAIKMAEIDDVSGYQFTQPTTSDGESLVKPNELLYFSDLGGGPGGAAEYILWRKQHAAKGWGLTRQYKEALYNLGESKAISPEYFDAYYGPADPSEINDNVEKGSFFDRATVEGFIELVMKGSDYKGVHVVTTVGSFNGLGNTKDNETVWKPVLLCQIHIALKVLRKGGNFVLKMFDVKTNYSASLTYLLFQTFEKVMFRKPFTAVPGTSERAVICLGRKCQEEIVDVVNYLEDCHRQMCMWKLNCFKNDHHKKFGVLIPENFLAVWPFVEKLKNINNKLKECQRLEIIEIMNCGGTNTPMFADLVKKRVDRLKTMIFSEWKLSRKMSIDILCREQDPELLLKHIGPENREDLDLKRKTVTYEEALTFLNNSSAWNFVPISDVTGSYGIYIGVGGRYIYQYQDGKMVDIIKTSPEARFVLAKGTVVVGEIVKIRQKMQDGSEDKKFKYVFYIFDGMMLGGQDIRNLPFDLRVIECEKYAKAVTQYQKSTYAEVRVTKSHSRAQLFTFLRELQDSTEEVSTTGKFPLLMKIQRTLSGSAVEMTEVTGVLFLETGTNCGLHVNFLNTLQKAVIWKWDRSELLRRRYWETDAVGILAKNCARINALYK